MADLAEPSISQPNLLDNPLLGANLALLADSDLVATVEATSDQLDVVAKLAVALPTLRIVLDHFGWPTDPSDSNLAEHVERLAHGSDSLQCGDTRRRHRMIFGDWTTGQVRTWLLAVTDTFGPERCMLGSDLPIENLRSKIGQLYAAYDDIFSGHSDYERARLFHGTAEEWYGTT